MPKGHKPRCRCAVCVAKRNAGTRTVKRNHGYENQAAALHERRSARKNSTVPLKGMRTRSAEARRKGPRFINPIRSRAGTNVDAAHELGLYAENTGELYPMFQSVQKNLITKWVKGTYNTDLAEKAWLHVANRAAQMYTREMGERGPHGSYGIFGPAERKLTASMLTNHFEGNAGYGEYDYLLPKKYQPKRNVSIAGNPSSHYPRTGRGPKGTQRWYILDLYDGRDNLISTRIKKGPRAVLATEAAQLVDRKAGKRIVRKVELSGPYSRKPTASTTRK